MIKTIFSRNPPSIKRKRESYWMYWNSLFGNSPRIWESYNTLVSSKYSGEVTIRSKKGILKSDTLYNVKINEVQKEIAKLEKKGITQRELTFNESMPDKNISIQGEVSRLSEGLSLHYSEIKAPMNLALKQEPKNVTGLTAKLILQKKMPPEEFIILEEFLDQFPNDIIEFSTWTSPVGTLNKRTIIWEIRNY